MTRDQWRDFVRSRPVRTALFMTGLLLLILSPLVGAIPGPGGVLVFAAGLTLALRNSDWAKRQYVRFKRWQPKAGGWADWGLRRRSAKRREVLRKQREGEEAASPSIEGPPDAMVARPAVQPAENWTDSEGRAN